MKDGGLLLQLKRIYSNLMDTTTTTKPAYRNPALTVDAAVVNEKEEILLITRKNDPFKDCLAFPGGFVDYGEDPAVAVLRELEEETCLKPLKGSSTSLIGVYGDPKRDPRGHTVTICYLVCVPEGSKPTAADDAATAKFYPISKLEPDSLAFDHKQILYDVKQHLNLP